MDIQFDDDGQVVIIPIDKAVLVLTKQAFIAALQAGKRYRRQQQRQARIPPIEGRPDDHN